MYSIAHIPLSFKCKEVEPELVAQASKELSGLMPKDVNLQANLDLLGVVFDAAVVGVFNANDDGIDAEEALKALDSFVHKPCNYGHNSDLPIGHIVNYGLSEYKGDRIITTDEASALKVFDISLAAVIYLRVYEDGVHKIIESTSPESTMYNGVCASWEVGFTDYDIALCDSHDTTIENCERIAYDDMRFSECVRRLRVLGGSGVLPNGKYVKRILKNVRFLGIGFTENPAADVEPIQSVQESVAETLLTEEEKASLLNKKKEEDEEKAEKVSKNDDDWLEKQEKVVQLYVKCIESFNFDNMNKEEFIQLLENENVVLEEAVASSLFDACTKALEEGNTKYLKELEEKENAISEAKKAQEDAIAKIEALESQLSELQKKQEEAEAQELFNQRMSHFDSLYSMDDEERQVIAKRLSAIASEEEFQSFEAEIAVMWKNKGKEALNEQVLQQAKASVEETVIPNAIKENEISDFKKLAGGIKINVK